MAICFRGAFSAFLLLVLGGFWALSGQPRSQDALRPTPQDTESIVLGDSCITAECHADMGKKNFLHGPMNFGKCEPCHIPIDNRHRFQRSPTGRSLCLLCHELEPPKKNQHQPFAQDCTLCHLHHESDTRYFVKGGTGTEGCLQNCHQDFSLRHNFVHAPIERGGCLACHTSHQSDHERLLTHDPRELCVLCHVDFPARLETAVHVHEPLRKETCTVCHSPHGGETKYLLSADEKGRCRGCHENFFAEMESRRFPHTGMIEQQACRHCHEPHAAQRNHLLTAPVADLCLECHNKPVPHGERMLSNIAEQIEQGVSLHGPVRHKNCYPCHLPHGSDVVDLLNKPFPDGFYVSFYEGVFENCFHCHDQRIIQEEFSTRTEYRNGDQNLHFIHVNRARGRSCRVCHLEHASPEPKLMRARIPYGNWILPVDFEETPRGGVCQSGCHEPFRYDRVSPISNKQEPPAAAGVPETPARKPHPVPPARPEKFEARLIPSPVLPALAAGQPAPPFFFHDAWEAQQRAGEGAAPVLLLFLKPDDEIVESSLSVLNQLLLEPPFPEIKMRRWILFPAGTHPAELERARKTAGDEWEVLFDGEDRLFSTYRAVRTPACILIGQDGYIRFAKSGHAREIADSLRAERSPLLEQKLAGTMPPPIVPAQLTLQMARRLAARGLWETALRYYLDIQKREGLTDSTLLELAEIYIELDLPDSAIEILQSVTPDRVLESRMTDLLKRAAQLKAGIPEEMLPPAVTR